MFIQGQHLFRSTSATARLLLFDLSDSQEFILFNLGDNPSHSGVDEEDDKDPFAELEEYEDEISENEIVMGDC